jgi:transposase
MHTTVVGLDLGKRVFQVHVASPDAPPIKRKLSRDELLPFLAAIPRGLVAMEAAGSAHFWSREISALGHETKLIPPKYVTPFRKGNKNDAKDAEAICEAAQRPYMRFAVSRTPDEQSILLLHTLRRHAIGMRVASSNALHSILQELGLVADSTDDLIALADGLLTDTSGSTVPLRLRRALRSLVDAWRDAQVEEQEIDAEIANWAAQNRLAKLLRTIPGVGPQSASVAAATMGNPSNFTSGAQFAAFVGLAPTHWGTGGRTGIREIPARAGYLRTLLYQGASTIASTQKKKKFVDNPWLGELLERKPRNWLASPRQIRRLG